MFLVAILLFILLYVSLVATYDVYNVQALVRGFISRGANRFITWNLSFFFHTQVSVNHLIHGFNDDKLFKYLCINLNGDELSVRVELSRAYVEWLKSITVHWM